MDTVESLNAQYVEIKNVVERMTFYDNEIAATQRSESELTVKISSTLDSLKKMKAEFGDDNWKLINDSIELGTSYFTVIKAINDYKNVLVEIQKLGSDYVYDRAQRIHLAQKKFDEQKERYEMEYHYSVESDEMLNIALAVCIRATIPPIQKRIDELISRLHNIIKNEETVELSPYSEIRNESFLPERLLVAQQPDQVIKIQILQDIGKACTYHNIYSDIRNQGNVMINCDLDYKDSTEIDNFVFSYIFRYLESFPLGSVNVHVFGKNTNYLYKRMCNNFMGEDSSDIAKRTIQIHSDISELSFFRDVICEDIFKKTSLEKPDLFSIYEKDASDVFHLIILRDGIIEEGGYSAKDYLDTLYSLSKVGNTGYRCGLRFLAIESKEVNKNSLTGNMIQVVERIKQNFSITMEYDANGFRVDRKKVVPLHIENDLETYVQGRSKQLALLINQREKSYVSIDELITEATSEPEAVYYIPVGRTGGDIVELPLSCKDEKGTLAGQCIGYMVIGQSGSGKSSFFHSLVINGCMKYSPRDLKFWLLDFKNGGASSKYREAQIPHIEMIAEDNKLDDAFCLFQMILEEMERRSRAFNKLFVDNIIDYNKLAIQNKLEYFPRIIIAIDEVQEIFREDSASTIQKMISSISTRMRSAGMHFVMIAQNLSEGKSYMLKDAFLPSATGRVCFRVAQDIPRDSGFDDDFVQRKQEISELKTGEAYVGYGRNTIKRVRMAYISSKELSEKCFVSIRKKYALLESKKTLVIGTKQRLSVRTSLQRDNTTYIDEINRIQKQRWSCSAIIGEDVYRMLPLKVHFSQYENSAVLILGSDKRMASSVCSSFAISLMKQGVITYLFNGDRTKFQDEYDAYPHPFMYVCQNSEKSLNPMGYHKLNEFIKVIGDIYSEYINRQETYQKSDDEAPDFEPMVLVVNDLFGIEPFVNNESVSSEKGSHEEINKEFNILEFDISDMFSDISSAGNKEKGKFNEDVQTIMNTLVKNGWRYNIHVVLAMKGDPYSWRNFRGINEVNNVLLFNSTEFADQMENSYYLKEMLKNIASDNECETLAVWSSRKKYSKIRPIIYDLSDENELLAIDNLLKGGC